MLNGISKKSGVVALAIGALVMTGASLSAVQPAAAFGGHGGGHGGHGGGHWGGDHWGGGHWGGHWGGGYWGHGPRWGLYGRPLIVGRYAECERVYRTIYVPGEGHVRTRTRVCY